MHVHVHVYVITIEKYVSTCKFHLDHRLDVDRHVGLPNFDNLFSSFLLVFQVSVCTMDRTVTNLMLFLCTLTSAL